MRSIKDILHLIYPELCAACGQALMEDEQYICLQCRFSLPKTHFHKEEGNPVEKVFWGRVPIYSAASYLYFTKQSRVQELLHNIKYRGIKEAAALIGNWYGDELKKYPHYQADAIIPVPLHKAKLKKRGYNQAEWFAKGLAQASGIMLDTDSLQRIRHSDTQTKKGRFKRWENVAEIFRYEEKKECAYNHILLVDDVITTGATLEACAQSILTVNCNTKISIITLAFASF